MPRQSLCSAVNVGQFFFAGPLAPAHVLFKQEAIKISLFFPPECGYFAIAPQHSQTTNMQCSYRFRKGPQHKVISLHQQQRLTYTEALGSSLGPGSHDSF